MAQTTLDAFSERWNRMFETEMEKCITDQKPLIHVAPNDSVLYVPPSSSAAGVGDLTIPSHTHGYTSAQANVPIQWGEQHLQSMLSSRMSWGHGVSCPFPRVLPWKVTPETVVVFVVLADSAIIIEDDANLYPSDALVTQLRILAEAT